MQNLHAEKLLHETRLCHVPILNVLNSQALVPHNVIYESQHIEGFKKECSTHKNI